MKRQYIILLAGLLITCLAFAFTKKHSPEPKNVAGGGFALIELYTSEGCSSCPPADKLLAKIAQEYKDKEVYVLAYHVDYWNRLGWKDAFSSPQYSARQNEYAKFLKSPDGVYTPQAIVNGKTEFIGSEEGMMRAVIKQELSAAPSIGLALGDFKQDEVNVTVKYHVKGAIGPNDVLYLAAVQRNADTQVTAGENKGRTLVHVNVVRDLESNPLKGNDGTAMLKLQGLYKNDQWNVIGFIEDKSTGKIRAAQWAWGSLKENIKKLAE